ncbi:hypothetical protein [Bifidobacterium sp.]|uniref:hypothetical protein n=1 Tax=Bifidobacterium sp. TaxID=41200 RepID=UPI0025BA1D56|nr:hypothetical protein [Bifidobacterium sp.]MCI1636098.1 hypothetical protein [Bifidobacterium sp.]
MPGIAVLTNVGTVLEQLVQRLRREQPVIDRAHPSRVQLVGDPLAIITDPIAMPLIPAGL